MRTPEQLAEEEAGLQDIVDELWNAPREGRDPSPATQAAAELLELQHQMIKRVRAELARLRASDAQWNETAQSCLDLLERALEGE